MNLEISDLRKSYGAHSVLNGIHLSLSSASSLVLLGPSGCGKSTLLRIIAGIESADSGKIQINGCLVDYNSPSIIDYRKSIGTVFQAYNLFPHLNAIRNITLPLEVAHGKSKEEAESIAYDLLRRFKLDRHALQMPAALSGGQKQRIAIARAIAIRPTLFLFDEPTSALDPDMAHEVLEMIKELRKNGSNLILVTHELGFAARCADTIAVLDSGHIVEQGAPSRLFASPSSPALQSFLDRHRATELPGKNREP